VQRQTFPTHAKDVEGWGYIVQLKTDSGGPTKGSKDQVSSSSLGVVVDIKQEIGNPATRE